MSALSEHVSHLVLQPLTKKQLIEMEKETAKMKAGTLTIEQSNAEYLVRRQNVQSMHRHLPSGTHVPLSGSFKGL
jgi:hypothetical protein